jgi:hypothetical protein
MTPMTRDALKTAAILLFLLLLFALAGGQDVSTAVGP